MKSIEPIIIAGGGPVGVIAALAFARQDIPVQVFEAESRVNDNPRAATTHAATLTMLEDLGLVEEVIRRGPAGHPHAGFPGSSFEKRTA